MKILAIEKENSPGSDARCAPYLKQEALRAWELYEEGIFREIYFAADRSKAIIILECKDLVEAREVLDSLPLVRQGFISFDMIPLKAYPGFSRLFEAQDTTTFNKQR